jgi:GT2 family glycosyltransferase
MKVAIGIPSGDMIHTDFAMSLVNLVGFSMANGIQCAVINQKSSVVEIGRCEIMASALGIEADYLLFLDSDMVFPHYTLLNLLKHGEPIVGCDASRRRAPFDSVIAGADGKPIDHATAKGLVEIKGASTACLLVSNGVMKSVGLAPFQVTWNGKEFLGEDYYFSNRVRESGYKIYCDADLSKEIGHIGMRAYFVGKRSMAL